ncbi:Uncharacterised protein [Vibrio cholerae]|nr:Uncharacterised protein [Vibrio cholerae]CSD02886.1 Uncharacterised protein [Vibrio cholerae]CSD58164.1 Uncharacterised protein [Vibrio cholerae]CSI40206.1 Uncharacterised protein [Vibrio cholerae]CSI77938.1 Uncharacterised protein [Vibrio cholerae]
MLLLPETVPQIVVFHREIEVLPRHTVESELAIEQI